MNLLRRLRCWLCRAHGPHWVYVPAVPGSEEYAGYACRDCGKVFRFLQRSPK